MTPEELDAINNLNQTIQSLGANTSIQNDLLKKMAAAQGINVKNINDNLDKFGKSVSSASGAAQSLKTAEDNYLKALQNVQQATISTVAGFKTLSNTILDTNRNFAKYNSALTSFGDAAQSLGKALGPMANVIGNVVKGFTVVGAAALKQADNVNKAYDDLAKVGGAGGLTTKEIMNMGLQAGLMSKDLGKLTSAIKANSTSLAGLGENAAQGIKIFGQMTAVGTETIANYSKLGVSQEDLIKTQADYVALQVQSGRSIKSEVADRQKLQKASLEYQDNLLTLSQLTGSDVETIKKKQQEAARAFEWQMWNMRQENRARELDRQGRKDEAQKIREDQEKHQKGLDAITELGTEQAAKGMREFITTGTATSEEAKQLITLGLSDAMAVYKENIAKGANPTEEAAKFTDAYNEAYRKAASNVGMAGSLSKDVRKALFGDEATILKVNQQTTNRDKKLQDEVTAAGKRIEEQKSTNDKGLKARADLTELEIKAGKALEDFLSKVNPLMGGSVAAFVALSAAVGAASLALTKFALKAGLPGGAGAAAAAGGVGKMAKGLGKAGALAAGGALLGVGADMARESGNVKTGAGLDVASSAASGAGIGATVGSIIPGIGTAVGAGVGAAIGAGVGLYQNWGTLTKKSEEGSATGAAAETARPAGSVGALLDFIGRNESRGDYNILVGGKRANLTDMTVAEVLDLQSRMRGMGHETSAVGKYQILRGTLLGIMDSAGVSMKDKFDQTTQDKLGVALLKRRGLESYQGKKITADDFADRLAMEWASLPTRSGKSHYAGVGSNASHVARSDFMQALPQARYGGSFSGPNSGYLVALHGNETVIPNFRLPEASSGSVIKQELPSIPNMSSMQSQSSSMDSRVFSDMMALFENKFDKLIDAVNSSNDTQTKILKYSRA